MNPNRKICAKKGGHAVPSFDMVGPGFSPSILFLAQAINHFNVGLVNATSDDRCTMIATLRAVLDGPQAASPLPTRCEHVIDGMRMILTALEEYEYQHGSMVTRTRAAAQVSQVMNRVSASRKPSKG